jgi:FG-GAP-like repeat
VRTHLGLASCMAFALGCSNQTGGRGDGGNRDLSIVFDDDAMFNGCDPQHPCPAGKVCFENGCIPDNGTCTGDDDCQNDSYCLCQGGGGQPDGGACLDGLCVPYGVGPRGPFDPDCMGPTFSPSQFVAPQVKCQYNMGTPTVLSTPLVIDLDRDGKPEIVFVAYSKGLIAIHGNDCKEVFNVPFTFAADGQSQVAAADLDGDKFPEIVGIDAGGKVVVFDHTGKVIANSPMSSGAAAWDSPAIADVDGQFPPEIIVGGQVSRYVKGQNALTVLWTKPVQSPTGGSTTIVADIDNDGKPEVICGKQVFDGVTGADKTPPALAGIGGGGGFNATGDFNGDKKPDLVTVQSGQVSIFDFANNKVIFGPFQTGDPSGGAPVVADFDGDGVPEFGTAGGHFYFVFSMKCDPNKVKAPQCDKNTNIGLLWQKPTRDFSSGVTASSVFDFNGDGKAEVVYRDECWLRVYNGPDGKTLFAASVTSVTCTEEVVVADTDNDMHADIVVSSDALMGSCQGNEPDTGAMHAPPTSGVIVYQDPMNRWTPSRAIWNQNAYHITNVNDDGTVPIPEKANWTSWNNYRQNTQSMFQMGGPKADYTGGQSTSIDNGQADCTTVWTLRANLCNRGTDVVQPGVPGAFYRTDPRLGNAMPICVGTTSGVLNPGDCETVKCDWMNPPQEAVDLWFRANDDGVMMVRPECHRMNDTLFLPGAACMKIG